MQQQRGGAGKRVLFGRRGNRHTPRVSALTQQQVRERMGSSSSHSCHCSCFPCFLCCSVRPAAGRLLGRRRAFCVAALAAVPLLLASARTHVSGAVFKLAVRFINSAFIQQCGTSRRDIILLGTHDAVSFCYSHLCLAPSAAVTWRVTWHTLSPLLLMLQISWQQQKSIVRQVNSFSIVLSLITSH